MTLYHLHRPDCHLVTFIDLLTSTRFVNVLMLTKSVAYVRRCRTARSRFIAPVRFLMRIARTAQVLCFYFQLFFQQEATSGISWSEATGSESVDACPNRSFAGVGPGDRLCSVSWMSREPQLSQARESPSLSRARWWHLSQHDTKGAFHMWINNLPGIGTFVRCAKQKQDGSGARQFFGTWRNYRSKRRQRNQQYLDVLCKAFGVSCAFFILYLSAPWVFCLATSTNGQASYCKFWHIPTLERLFFVHTIKCSNALG